MFFHQLRTFQDAQKELLSSSLYYHPEKKIHVSFPRIRMSLNPSLQAGFHQILVTQPRRIAAISLARRVSCEQMDAKSRVVGQLGEQPKVLCFRRMCGKVWKINDFCTWELHLFEKGTPSSFIFFGFKMLICKMCFSLWRCHRKSFRFWRSHWVNETWEEKRGCKMMQGNDGFSLAYLMVIING